MLQAGRELSGLENALPWLQVLVSIATSPLGLTEQSIISQSNQAASRDVSQPSWGSVQGLGVGGDYRPDGRSRMRELPPPGRDNRLQPGTDSPQPGHLVWISGRDREKQCV